jgi:hypothetical protein
VAKRARHRRALIRLLMDEFEDHRLVICVDPSALDFVQDFASDKGDTRILFLDTALDDDYLRGHIQACRAGQPLDPARGGRAPAADRPLWRS